MRKLRHSNYYVLPDEQPEAIARRHERNLRGVIFVLAIIASGAVVCMIAVAAASHVGWAGQ